MTPLDKNKCMDIARNCACFHLRRTARLVSQAFDQKLKKTGLRITQFSLLMAFFLLPEARLSKIARIMGMDRTTLSRNVKLLEKKGLVSMEPGEDRREQQVRLSPKGEQALEEAIPCWEEAQNQVMCQMDDDDWGQVHNVLRELAASARE